MYDAISELIEEGYLEREKVGRRNCYRLVKEPDDGEAGEGEAVGRLGELLDEATAEQPTQRSPEGSRHARPGPEP